jgi:hypothetical protein
LNSFLALINMTYPNYAKRLPADKEAGDHRVAQGWIGAAEIDIGWALQLRIEMSVWVLVL